jgi:CHASE1-domain containing sensor protein
MNEQQKKALARVQTSKQEMEELDREIEKELKKVKDRLDELQNAKKSSRQAFDEAWSAFKESIATL